MSNEISWRGLTTGSTKYFTIRAAPNSYWHTDGTPGFETGQAAHWGNYAIAMSEVSGLYLYLGTWPAGLTTVGFYWVEEYRQAGGSPAIADTMVGQKYGYWNGTTFEVGAADVKTVAGTLQTAADIGSLVAKFTGITSVGNWLRGLFRSSTMDSTAKTEVNTGGGGYNEAVASAQAMAASVGTPVALDGGAATVAGMLTKLADDNGGATFDATTDSQHTIGTLAAAIKAVTDKLTFDLVSTVNYLKVTTYGFCGSLLTGTAAYIRAAFDTAFNVATGNPKVDVDTMKTKSVTVDTGGTTFPASVGSGTSTLAAQGVADALKLAPTAGAPAAGSMQAGMNAVAGSDGATLATAQAHYAPAKAGDSMKISVGTGAGQLNVSSGKTPATIASGDAADIGVAGAGLTAIGDSRLDGIAVDLVTDTTTTPWTLKAYRKGTNTLLFSKQLYDKDGTELTSASTLIGQQLDPSSPFVPGP